MGSDVGGCFHPILEQGVEFTVKLNSLGLSQGKPGRGGGHPGLEVVHDPQHGHLQVFD